MDKMSIIRIKSQRRSEACKKRLNYQVYRRYIEARQCIGSYKINQNKMVRDKIKYIYNILRCLKHNLKVRSV